jgi:peptidyl-tRNA hydrolase, PTH1 family
MRSIRWPGAGTPPPAATIMQPPTATPRPTATLSPKTSVDRRMDDEETSGGGLFAPGLFSMEAIKEAAALGAQLAFLIYAIGALYVLAKAVIRYYLRQTRRKSRVVSQPVSILTGGTSPLRPGFALVVGFGNPGTRMRTTGTTSGFGLWRPSPRPTTCTFRARNTTRRTAHGHIGSQRVILAQPQTWMNDSGKAVGPLARFYKVAPEDMLVIYDDLDIPSAPCASGEGSSGGHRGLQSIMQLMGTESIPRLRLGIGRPPGRMDPAAYVLQNFSNDEIPLVWQVLRTARDLVLDWLAGEPDLQRPGMTWRVETTD